MTDDSLLRVWSAVGGHPGELERLTRTRSSTGLGTAFRVAELATAATALTLLAADGFRADRTGDAQPVDVDESEALASFASERLLRVDGQPLGSLWSPLSGDYRARDGWVRLHCNFPTHEAAATTALAVIPDRDVVAAAVARRPAVEVEEAVLAAGGAAAALRGREEWLAGAAGQAAQGVPVVLSPLSGTGMAAEPRPPADDPSRPLAGVRVVELTRVIAGPVAGRVLAALGADVVHVRSPHLPTLPGLDLDTGLGKRATLLHLHDSDDRRAFERLLAGADVVLQSYRPGALAGLGYGPDRLAGLRPGLVIAQVSAYGPHGPWRGRRGFDSLVQMAAGIADEGRRRTGSDVPVPLPVQALDHATGWLTALGVVQALRGQARGRLVDTSLARTAAWLDSLGRDEGANGRGELPDLPLVAVDTELGRLEHVPMPGRIGGVRPTWSYPPAPPGPVHWLP
jgi:crotonobetainyl-CoA:carnitine CoA-transferase CaiB-like acyl-CoA transferase